MINKKTLPKIFVGILLVLVTLAVLFAITVPTEADGNIQAGNGASASDDVYLKQNTAIKIDKESYYDGTKIFKLPGTVRDTDDLSIIIQTEKEALYDVYESTDKSMTFQEFLKTESANAVKMVISKEIAEITSILDEKEISYTKGVSYDTVLSGFEIVIKAKDFKTVATALDEKATVIVGEVYNPAKTELVENKVNVYETGIFDSSSFKYDGTGMVVAVLDTGLDYTHTAFSVGNFTADKEKLGLTYEAVSALLSSKDFMAEMLQNGLTANDVYISEKVPFAFDYADGDSEVFPINSDHGTHVAGIIAGKDDRITGVAPNAQLVIMKTFSDIESSARAAWILNALEDCVALGVDVINMSLGTDCGFSRPTDRENVNKIYDRIKEAGISLVVAASNSYNSTYGSEKNGNLGLTSNPDSATVGSPSTYDGPISVASISGVKTPYLLFGDKIIYYTESADRVSEEKVFLEDILKDGKTEAEIEFLTIPGVGRAADYTGIDVTGKIVLVRRGSSTFEEKANIAQQKGALGIIVYNNVSGDIKMNVGEATLGAISISQEDGEELAAAKTGVIKVSTAQVSGPFMSDFSSWGPTPSLGIKPEITAHGGSILSAVPGQDYDRISGTSMATPNMSGVSALLRQYVMDKFPEIKNDPVKVTAMVNCLLMSTADVINNKNGLPYSVRKQGAGLANLVSASETTAIIVTYDKNGNEMDKAKLELGDDVEKTGVYELNFAIDNFGSVELTYDLNVLVMTEGVSETKTSHGETTVTESAYMLGAGTVINSVVDGTQNGTKITVAPGKTAKVKATITLTDEDKKYLDESFKNGMYVEGFVQLKAVSGTEISLSVPYLAFYGDWTKAPMLDLDFYATNKDELDDAIDLEDKTLPDAYATRPVGSVEEDYVNYMGSFYFKQDPTEEPIAADRKYISISNQVGSVHSVKSVWAGLLRNCERVEIVVTDDATGEVVYETVDYDVRKSYSNGQTIFPANIDVGFDATELNLKNNTKYTVTLKTYLDYERDGSETNANNTFTFPVVTDFEAPAVTGVEFYKEYDKTTKTDRLYAKIAIYDNHYTMGMQVGYVGPDNTGSLLLTAFDQYIKGVTSDFNTTSYVTYELTDYIQEIKKGSYNKNTFTVAVYDYALNVATYEIGLPDEYTDFYFADEDGNAITDLYLNPNETFILDPEVYPNVSWSPLLDFTSTNTKSARIVNNKVIALEPGTSSVIIARDSETGKVSTLNLYVRTEYVAVGEDRYIYDPDTKTYTNTKDVENLDESARLYAKTTEGEYVKESDIKFVYDRVEKKYVRATGDTVATHAKNTKFKTISKPVVDDFYLTGYLVEKAYYFLNSEDRDIGVEGDEMKFVGEHYSLEMFPSEAIVLRYVMDAYFPNATEVVFSTSNDKIVSVDENGKIIANEEGFASVSVSVLMDGKSTYYSKTINITVKDPYVTTGPSLTNYFGNGGFVAIPETLAIKEIGQFAFSNYQYVAKEAWEIDPDNPSEAYKIWYLGEDTITTVVIPEGVEKINAYAFANLTALEKVVLPSTLTMIDQGAFYGCTKLKTIEGIENVKFINQRAFQGCALDGNLKFTNAVAIGNYAFASNANLDSIELGENTRSIGAYAFYGNLQLKTADIVADKIQLGMCAFADCKALTSINVNAQVIPAGAFDGASSLETVVLGKDVSEIGEYAFSGTKVKSFTIEEGNTSFFPVENKPYILNKERNEILLFAPGTSGEISIDDASITSVAKNAFSGCTELTTISIPSVTKVGNYAFAGCSKLAKIELGTLTSVGNYAFHRTSIISTHSFANLTVIGDYAYAETQVVSVTIPDGVTVGEGAFRDCTKLATVTIGDNVTLKQDAFRYNNASLGLDGFTTGKDTIDGKEVYFYVYKSPMVSLTIGKNADIGNGAFYGVVSLKKITLGEGAKIGAFAFYNADKLVDVDLSKAVSIGASAFSGDVLYQYTDSSLQNIRVDAVTGQYYYIYYTPDFEEINISGVNKLGSEAFAHCRKLEKVTLGEALDEIPTRTFASCSSLEEINLENVKVLGLESFAETVLERIDLSKATEIGNYAFVYCEELRDVKLNQNEKVAIGEGAFSYCDRLANVDLSNVKSFGDYAFAYTRLTNIDLTGAESIGTHAFMKERLTRINVKLGSSLKEIGDNPFAMCRLDEFTKEIVTGSFNGVDYKETTNTFDISEAVKVIDGSIYRVVPNGYELIAFAGNKTDSVVADNTVRISALAYAGSDVVKVILPRTVASIGSKAFYGCEKLAIVSFSSYNAPVLEEEYDYAYYSSMENLPATGMYDFVNFDGSPLYIPGLEIVPYFMYNVASTPTNIYYGANFVDYIGKTEGNLLMVRPTNGQNYDSFIWNQYFNEVISGKSAPDEYTLAAIVAINKLPDIVALTDKKLVEEARAAYNLVVTNEQQMLIDENGLYAKLTKAENRIADLEYLENGNQGEEDKPSDEPTDKPTDTPIKPDENVAEESDNTVVIVVLSVILGVVVCAFGVLVFLYLKKNKTKTSEIEKADAEKESEEVAPSDEA